MGKADPLFISAKDNRTVRLIRDLIAVGEGTPELGFATNVGTATEPLWRSGSGWVGNYFTTNSLGRVVRTAVPQGGLTREQNDLSNEAAGSFYRDALYQRYPKFAKAMPSEAMAVMGDVFHHGWQENTKSPVWDRDNQAVWAARNNDKVAQAYLLGRGYSDKWDFNEVAARQILDYTKDSGTNRIYRRVIQRFNVLRNKLGKDKRPWDYFDPKADKAKKDALTVELKKAWAEVNKGERADEKGGDAGGEVTENAETVNNAGDADIPVSNGPRIVINPTTFRNRKDALCVAFNERFRIAMEQYGFEPKSEPTERQRRFFADTAYADDEVMLRRTILARILTLDTSVKDPTDEQMREALAFLGEFGKREHPSNDWEANAIRRLARLVESTLPKGDRK